MTLRGILYLGLFGLFSFPLTAIAATVNVPVFASYALMQELIQRELFNSPEHTAVYAADKLGCTTVSFANPELSGVDNLLQVRANVDVNLGLPSSRQKCTPLTQWSGSAAVKGAPVVVGAESLAIQFKVADAQVYDARGEQLHGGIIQQALKSRLHPLLDQFKLDLQPTVARAKTLLPPVLHGYSTAQIAHLFDSLQVGNIKADARGLTINMQMDALNPGELTSLAGNAPHASAASSTARDWDGLISLIVKQMSKKTDSPQMREALLEVLQDARQQLQGAEQKANKPGIDPLKVVFINTWARLVPLARTLKAAAPHQELLQLLSFLSAEDLFNTLEALGTGLGIDISAQGLLHLVQSLSNQSGINTLK